MNNPLIRKLEQFTRLSGSDRTILDELASTGIRRLGARRDLVREGEKPRAINLMLDGWAFRYKMLEDGRRQIISFFLPGDLCDLNIYLLREMDHSIAALTPLTFCEIPRDTFEQVTERPRIVQALWWDSLVAAAIQREWTVNLGQRNALERISHLICELFFRIRGVGLNDDSSFFCPITQNDLAEATGMTSVHVNRTLQELRGRGLVHWKGKQVEIPDLGALCQLALFNQNYLHLDREGAHLDAND
ncbi:Crp/Fnr family transcriptional regulator [uncultured Sphingomonas sp.]|uniref:Crp/Fnr family transcriptional regulator n=1 Tax=Sphingomonas sp. TaxID=28214 RepID=UPI0026333C3A|nr:Crp/Fnr family transcriptional regulator [uncultured Sphingomonas sp.]